MTKKRSIFATLAAATGLALAYRKVGKQREARIEGLRPHGHSGKRVRAARAKDRLVRNVRGAARASTSSTPSSNTPSSSATPSRDKTGNRGQTAAVPEEIPPRGWLDIAKRTAKQFSENELMSEAASITFFALLSLFPAIAAIVSIYGLFADPSTIQSHLDSAAGFVPSGGLEIIRDQVKRLTQSPASGLSFGAAFGILAALWSANQGSKAMLSALNDVYGEREGRGFIRLTATSLAFTGGGILALLAGIGLLLVLPLVFNALGLAGALDLVIRIARWPVLLIGLMLGLSILYRFGPSRHRAKWRWVTWGGAIGAIGWIALSYGFSWYVTHFGSYNKTYGSLGAIIGFMTWIWLSSTILLLGAQFNAEMETQTARDTTVGGSKPPGLRGAAAANRVA